MTRADLDKQPAEVAAMFDALAGRYDMMNDILSMGQVRLWRKRVQRILQARPGDRVLDLAAGTGTSSVVFAQSGADCVACDFSLGMLRAGRARLTARDPRQDKTRGRVAFAAGDALNLPFRDGAFDAVTISFGLRNTHGTREALAEMRRVTKSGGLVVIGVPGYAAAGTGLARRLLRRLRDLPSVRTFIEGHLAATPTLVPHDFPGDYYRFSGRAVRDVFMEGMEEVEVMRLLNPPRFIASARRSAERFRS